MRKPRRTKAEILRDTKVNSVKFHELSIFDKSYLERLDADVKYSLKIDPMNLYNFDEIRHQFIFYYLQHRNIPLVAKLCGIKDSQAIELYKEHAVREEIDRINIAMYLRNFSTKMLTIDEIGGYLSAIVTDQVAEVDKLSTKDKIPVLKMLIDLNTLKKEGYENPTVIDAIEFEEDVKNMSVKSIKALIDASYDTSSLDEKENIIDQIDAANTNSKLSAEDITFLKSLSKEELLQLLEELTGKEYKKNEN